MFTSKICDLFVRNAYARVRLILELPIVNSKLFLAKPVKMTGLYKMPNNRIFLYLSIYYFLIEAIPCYVVDF